MVIGDRTRVSNWRKLEAVLVFAFLFNFVTFIDDRLYDNKSLSVQSIADSAGTAFNRLNSPIYSVIGAFFKTFTPVLHLCAQILGYITPLSYGEGLVRQSALIAGFNADYLSTLVRLKPTFVGVVMTAVFAVPHHIWLELYNITLDSLATRDLSVVGYCIGYILVFTNQLLRIAVNECKELGLTPYNVYKKVYKLTIDIKDELDTIYLALLGVPLQKFISTLVFLGYQALVNVVFSILNIFFELTLPFLKFGVKCVLGIDLFNIISWYNGLSKLLDVIDRAITPIVLNAQSNALRFVLNTPYNLISTVVKNPFVTVSTTLRVLLFYVLPIVLPFLLESVLAHYIQIIINLESRVKPLNAIKEAVERLVHFADIEISENNHEAANDAFNKLPTLPYHALGFEPFIQAKPTVSSKYTVSDFFLLRFILSPIGPDRTESVSDQPADQLGANTNSKYVKILIQPSAQDHIDEFKTQNPIYVAIRLIRKPDEIVYRRFHATTKGRGLPQLYSNNALQPTQKEGNVIDTFKQRLVHRVDMLGLHRVLFLLSYKYAPAPSFINLIWPNNTYAKAVALYTSLFCATMSIEFLKDDIVPDSAQPVSMKLKTKATATRNAEGIDLTIATGICKYYQYALAASDTNYDAQEIPNRTVILGRPTSILRARNYVTDIPALPLYMYYAIGQQDNTHAFITDILRVIRKKGTDHPLLYVNTYILSKLRYKEMPASAVCINDVEPALESPLAIAAFERIEERLVNAVNTLHLYYKAKIEDDISPTAKYKPSIHKILDRVRYAVAFALSGLYYTLTLTKIYDITHIQNHGPLLFIHSNYARLHQERNTVFDSETNDLSIQFYVPSIPLSAMYQCPGGRRDHISDIGAVYWQNIQIRNILDHALTVVQIPRQYRIQQVSQQEQAKILLSWLSQLAPLTMDQIGLRMYELKVIITEILITTIISCVYPILNDLPIPGLWRLHIMAIHFLLGIKQRGGYIYYTIILILTQNEVTAYGLAILLYACYYAILRYYRVQYATTYLRQYGDTYMDAVRQFENPTIQDMRSTLRRVANTGHVSLAITILEILTLERFIRSAIGTLISYALTIVVGTGFNPLGIMQIAAAGISSTIKTSGLGVLGLTLIHPAMFKALLYLAIGRYVWSCVTTNSRGAPRQLTGLIEPAINLVLNTIRLTIQILLYPLSGIPGLDIVYIFISELSTDILQEKATELLNTFFKYTIWRMAEVVREVTESFVDFVALVYERIIEDLKLNPIYALAFYIYYKQPYYKPKSILYTLLYMVTGQTYTLLKTALCSVWYKLIRKSAIRKNKFINSITNKSYVSSLADPILRKNQPFRVVETKIEDTPAITSGSVKQQYEKQAKSYLTITEIPSLLRALLVTRYPALLIEQVLKQTKDSNYRYALILALLEEPNLAIANEQTILKLIKDMLDNTITSYSNKQKAKLQAQGGLSDALILKRTKTQTSLMQQSLLSSTITGIVDAMVKTSDLTTRKEYIALCVKIYGLLLYTYPTYAFTPTSETYRGITYYFYKLNMPSNIKPILITTTRANVAIIITNSTNAANTNREVYKPLYYYGVDTTTTTLYTGAYPQQGIHINGYCFTGAFNEFEAYIESEGASVTNVQSVLTHLYGELHNASCALLVHILKTDLRHMQELHINLSNMSANLEEMSLTWQSHLVNADRFLDIFEKLNSQISDIQKNISDGLLEVHAAGTLDSNITQMILLLNMLKGKIYDELITLDFNLDQLGHTLWWSGTLWHLVRRYITEYNVPISLFTLIMLYPSWTYTASIQICGSIISMFEAAGSNSTINTISAWYDLFTDYELAIRQRTLVEQRQDLKELYEKDSNVVLGQSTLGYSSVYSGLAQASKQYIAAALENYAVI